MNVQLRELGVIFKKISQGKVRSPKWMSRWSSHPSKRFQPIFDELEERGFVYNVISDYYVVRPLEGEEKQDFLDIIIQIVEGEFHGSPDPVLVYLLW